MNDSHKSVIVEVTESPFCGEESNGETVFGITVLFDGHPSRIPDLACECAPVAKFAEKLRRNSFEPDNLFELAEDFVEELYGMDVSKINQTSAIRSSAARCG